MRKRKGKSVNKIMDQMRLELWKAKKAEKIGNNKRITKTIKRRLGRRDARGGEETRKRK